MNNWNFTGNLGRDSETRFTKDGAPIVNFTVGVKSGFGEKASTTWANCAMFGKRAEAVAPYLIKGALVGVCGELNNREYQDNDGQKRFSLDVNVSDLTLLGGKPKDAAQEPQKRSKPAQTPDYTDHADDCPF